MPAKRITANELIEIVLQQRLERLIVLAHRAYRRNQYFLYHLEFPRYRISTTTLCFCLE